MRHKWAVVAVLQENSVLGDLAFKSVSVLPLPFKDLSIFCLMCMSILPTCIDVYHVCACCSGRFEESVGFPRTGVTDDHKPPGGCWEPNLDPLEEPQVLIAFEPTLLPQTPALSMV